MRSGPITRPRCGASSCVPCPQITTPSAATMLQHGSAAAGGWRQGHAGSTAASGLPGRACRRQLLLRSRDRGATCTHEEPLASCGPAWSEQAADGGTLGRPQCSPCSNHRQKHASRPARGSRCNRGFRGADGRGSVGGIRSRSDVILAFKTVTEVLLSSRPIARGASKRPSPAGGASIDGRTREGRIALQSCGTVQFRHA